jgi:hypothetical protein
MKKLLSILLILLISQSLFAQKKIWNETEAEKEKRLEWWQNDRFGMFIHWGTYALAGRHEWVNTFRAEGLKLGSTIRLSIGTIHNTPSTAGIHKV